jgi:signal transduction histidine kinase
VAEDRTAHTRADGTGMKTRLALTAPAVRLSLVIVIGLTALAAVLWLAIRPTEPGGGIRPLFEQPIRLWPQLVVGLGATILSGWVWALRPRDLATRLFALSGLATLIFTFAAGAMDVQGILLGDNTKFILMVLNGLGASVFGITFIALFLVYPGHLKSGRPAALVISLIFALWTVLALMGHLPPALASVHMITTLEMLGILIAVGLQFIATRRDPTAHAITIWFGLAVFFGAGSFIVLNAIPSTFGYPVLMRAEYSFCFFGLIYLGVAAGLRRFRLFELGEWAFRILFYAAGTAVLIALDALLILTLPIGQGSAFGLSLLLVAFAYLPMRDALARRFMPRSRLREDALFGAVVEVALEPARPRRAERWAKLVSETFNTLETRTDPAPVETPEIREEGLALHLPALAGIPPLVLRFPWAGRGLFGPPQLDIARRLIDLMTHAEASRDAYDRGVAEERGRIARDMHDNIGAQLLGALHSADHDRKDLMIRETLTDLRDIINNASTPGLDLDETLADLRLETADRLEAVGMALDWSMDIGNAPSLSTGGAHALRSIIREAVSNTIKHSGASRMDIAIRREGDTATLILADNGRSLHPTGDGKGHGLANIQSRSQGLKGQLSLTTDGPGTRIELRFPLANATAAITTAGTDTAMTAAGWPLQGDSA